MNPLFIEKYQVWLYLAAITAGISIGVLKQPGIADTLIYIPLGLLLYATFSQVPITHLPEAMRNRHYLAASLIANFIIVPILVWLLARLIPQSPVYLIGFYMVLLVPCTDWFIVFTHLGRGNTKLAITSAPVILLAQFILLPGYLWLFIGETFSEVIQAGPFLNMFVLLIIIPLIAAGLTQFWADRKSSGRKVVQGLGWLPVPCLAIVLFLIAISQAGQIVVHILDMERVIIAFVLYLIFAALIAVITARVFRLEPAAGRTLAFSVGTRNSFVVLPFALALPAGWEIAVTIVVLQPLVELLGMLVYLRILPLWKP